MGAKEKGIIDLMNTQKVKKIDRRDLSNVFKDIEDEAKINLLNNWIERLRTCAREDCIFPLAGQDFRNNVIEFIEQEKKVIQVETKG